MVFGLFKRKCPLCGMKEEKGKGVEKSGMWYCSEKCVKEYERTKIGTKKSGSCCG